MLTDKISDDDLMIIVQQLVSIMVGEAAQQKSVIKRAGVQLKRARLKDKLSSWT
jgi:hypothetical protein